METYTNLESIVLPYLVRYKEDLTRHDKKTLQEYSGPFLYGYRPTGTYLVKLLPTVNDYFNQMVDKDDPDPDSKEKILEMHITCITGSEICNKLFIYFDGKKLHSITKERANEIYKAHCSKIMAAYRNELQQTI